MFPSCGARPGIISVYGVSALQHGPHPHGDPARPRQVRHPGQGEGLLSPPGATRRRYGYDSLD